MARFLVVAWAVLLAACGGSSGPSLPVVQGPPSAQMVVGNEADFARMSKCPESGSWENYLKAEQTKNPSQYDTDKKSWDDFKAAGANDSYVAVYAQDTSDCGQFAAGTPSAEVANVYAIRFKDTASASSNFKTNSKTFHLTDSDVASLKAAGGTVQQGAATGLGDNSIVVSIAFGSSSVYVAFWEKKQFEVALVSFNLPIATGTTVTKKISDRIP